MNLKKKFELPTKNKRLQIPVDKILQQIKIDLEINPVSNEWNKILTPSRLQSDKGKGRGSIR